jgi:nucleoid-associated protein
MANKILNIAIHDLDRGEDGFRVTLGKNQLAVTATTQRVIDDLYDLYSRRASKSHGKFSANEDYSPTQKHLQEYVKGGLKEFAALTAKMMTTLRIQAGSRNAAQGGHVFFAHFESEGRQFLLVAIINDKLGATLTKDYDVADIQHLDMEGFRFAGRINVTGWAANEERYIGFLKGKGAVSEYFKAFLGCDTPPSRIARTQAILSGRSKHSRMIKAWSAPIKTNSWPRRRPSASDRLGRGRRWSSKLSPTSSCRSPLKPFSMC